MLWHRTGFNCQSDYIFAGIFAVEKADSQILRLAGYALSQPYDSKKDITGYLSGLTLSTASPWFGAEQRIESVEAARICDGVLRQIFTSHIGSLDKLAKEAGFGALLIVKLLARQKLVGVLIIGTKRPGAESSETDRPYWSVLAKQSVLLSTINCYLRRTS